MFKKLAPRIGAKVLMEPEWEIAGQITFRNGRRRYIRYSSIDLNPLAASDIAKDKDFANFFMKKMGYPTIEGKTFFVDWWAKTIHSKRGIDEAYAYARRLGFPVIVKPNSGSQGVGVALVHNAREFYPAMRTIFMHDRVGLVQRPVYGTDYRIVVLDDQVISAYERQPLSVLGDGASTIRKLLLGKQIFFKRTGRDTRLNLDDPRIILKLKRQGLSFKSVPEKGKRIYLLDNANLSAGGDAVDVTESIHPEFKKIAIRLTRDMGLRICGVDLMVEGDISKKPGKYWILEINAAPGLDHYVKIGRAQEKIVENLYLKVLKSMSK